MRAFRAGRVWSLSGSVGQCWAGHCVHPVITISTPPVPSTGPSHAQARQRRSSSQLQYNSTIACVYCVLDTPCSMRPALPTWPPRPQTQNMAQVVARAAPPSIIHGSVGRSRAAHAPPPDGSPAASGLRILCPTDCPITTTRRCRPADPHLAFKGRHFDCIPCGRSWHCSVSVGRRHTPVRHLHALLRQDRHLPRGRLQSHCVIVLLAAPTTPIVSTNPPTSLRAASITAARSATQTEQSELEHPASPSP